VFRADKKFSSEIGIIVVGLDNDFAKWQEREEVIPIEIGGSLLEQGKGGLNLQSRNFIERTPNLGC
jgi:hypothetical protein